MAAFEESWGVSGRDNYYAIPNVSLEWFMPFQIGVWNGIAFY